MHSRPTTVKARKSLSKITLFIIFIFVFGLVFFSIKEYINKKKLDAEILALNQELQTLTAAKQDFLQTIDHYNSDFFVEQEARTKLNMKKPGENVVVVKLDDVNRVNAETDGANANYTAGGSMSNFVRWWNFFFNH
ncbi:TPA: hypothetical protein DF272_02005 [Candidatus Falkowbacteria bacterium]|nr:hypothetical protein [Candidatus Falkowbacteria bacterium]